MTFSEIPMAVGAIVRALASEAGKRGSNPTNAYFSTRLLSRS